MRSEEEMLSFLKKWELIRLQRGWRCFSAGNCPDVNYKEEQALIDSHILDSFLILELVAELEDTFYIRISPADIVAENFNSAGAMWKMIERLKKER